VAVDAFLRNQIGFTEIADIIEDTLKSISFSPAHSLVELLEQDHEARQRASACLSHLA